MTSPTETPVVVLNATDEQVQFYQQNGWVKVPGLVPPEIAASMLEAATRYEEEAVSERARDLAMWREWRFVARDDAREPFRSVAYSPDMGLNISRLDGHGCGVRYWTDVLSKKSPAGTPGGSTGTGWHQDFPNHPIDRVGGATAWIALTDLEPEQGTMKFLSGSHREGPLGRTYSTGPIAGGTDQVQQHPWLLDRYEISEPLSLRAGDATFHHPLVVHGADPNNGTRPRWAFIAMYVAADSVYTGASYSNTDSLRLEVGNHFERPEFPVVWQGRPNS